MNWDDVDDVLYDGKKEDIARLKCPECGGNITFRFNDKPRIFEVSCKKCCSFRKGNGGPKPNCAVLYGDNYTIEK